MQKKNEIIIRKPDDFHLHVRDGKLMELVVPHSARQFRRALIMPNLNPPITTQKMALDYQQRILNCLIKNPKKISFQPLMTLYLTDNLNPNELKNARENNILACKLYPAGATTNSDFGVTEIKNIYPILEVMQQENLILSVHGEVTNPEIDIFDREAVFIEEKLIPLRQDFPELKITLEHITTKEAVDYVKESDNFLGATITPQHLMFNRNSIFVGGFRPHFYCLPILKREIHRQKLVEVAISGDSHFFLGTDSAPHLSYLKESSCGCAGCYSAFSALEMYLQVFDENNSLKNFENFTSVNGAKFYSLEKNQEKISFVKESLIIPKGFCLKNSSQELKPLLAGEKLNWKLKEY